MSKAKRVASWGDIDPAVFTEFEKAVEKLREEMIPRDCDGDSPIQYVIINRMQHEYLNYFPVPRYELTNYTNHGDLEFHPDVEQEMEDEHLNMLNANVHMAAGALDQYVRIKQHRNYVDRQSRRPLKDRVNETCEFCKKHMGFNLTDPGDFYQKTRAKYPDFPGVIHTNGERCKAHEMLRADYKKKHPDVFGKEPEPRYCPVCKAKLRNEETKKGKGDQDDCMNIFCPTFVKEHA